MAKVQVNEVFDVPEIESQGAKVISLLDKIEEKIKTVNDLGGTAKGASEAAKAANEMFKQATENLNNYTAVMKKQQADIAQLRKLDIAGSKEAIAVSKEVERQQKQEAKINAELASSYKQLELASKATTERYKNLAASLGQLHPLTVEAQKDAANLNNQLKAIDAGAGQYNRNVGNYSSATAGLNNNIRILASELPNAGISLRTFATSLSNNIGPFINSIKEVQVQNKALQLEGKATTSVVKTLGQSLLSSGVIVGVAVAVGLKLIDMWEQSQKAAKEAKKSTDELTEARKAAAKSAEETVAKEQTALTVLYRTATDLTQTYETRLAAVQKLQKEYPAYFQNLDVEAFKAGKAAEAYKELANAIIIKSEITAAEDELEVLAKQIRTTEKRLGVEKEFAGIKENRNLKDAKAAAADEQMAGKNFRQKVIAEKTERSLNNLYDTRKKIIDDILDKEKQIPKLLVENENLRNAGKPKAPRKGREISQEVSADVFKSIADQLNDFETEIGAKRDADLRDLMEKLSMGQMSVAEYEAAKKEIVLKSEDEILQEQLKYLQYRLEAIGLNAENQQKVIEKYTDLYNKEIKKRYDAEEAAALTSAKNLEGFQKAMYDNKDKADKEAEKKAREQADKEKAIAREKEQYIRAIAEETMQFVFTLLDAQTEKSVNALEKEKDANSVYYDEKRSEVENSFNTEVEKAAQIKVLNDEQKRAETVLNEEIKELKRKQAIFDKAQALATIAINTAVAASSPTNLALGGALTPLIIGLGAAQAAIVLATPLPEFAKGIKKDDPYEGLGIWGEAGTELLIDKSGKMRVASEPTLIYRQKGDEIISNKDLKKMMNPSQDGMVNRISYDELIRANAAQTDNQTKRLVKVLEKVEAAAAKNDVAAIIKMQTLSNWASK